MPTESPYFKAITHVSAFLLFTIVGVGVYRVRRRNAEIKRNLPKDNIQNKSGQHFRHLSRIKAESAALNRDGCVGYRYAFMVERGGRVYFASIHQKTVFATSADAICMASAPHTAFERKPHVKAPDKGCQCGYYSVTDVTELPIRASVSCSSHLVYLLEVNVSGVIIPAHAGYRAEHQEVIRVWLPVKCAQCNATPTGLAAIDGFGADMVRDKARDRGLVPVCELHAQDADAFYNIGDLRDLFATDFEWLNPAV